MNVWISVYGMFLLYSAVSRYTGDTQLPSSSPQSAVQQPRLPWLPLFISIVAVTLALHQTKPQNHSTQAITHTHARRIREAQRSRVREAGREAEGEREKGEKNT